MKPQDFVTSVAALRFEHTFNPYSCRCAVYDRADAPNRRSLMLTRLIEAALTTNIDAIWIGRDLGYRGGRRTGLAFTDDIHIGAHAARWGLPAHRPTKGEAVSERTAANIWRVLANIHAPVFLWNVFPLHPHEPNDPFSNRRHNSRERRAGEEILFQLVVLLEPKRLIAVGNDAAITARRLVKDKEVVQVRHPSYGGQREFVRQVSELYDLPCDHSERSHQQTISLEGMDL